MSPEKVKQASWDARLKLSAEEEAELLEQTACLFQQALFLQDKDLNAVPCTFYPLEQQNKLRSDVSRPSLPLKVALSNAPDADETCFQVPRIVE